MSVRAIILAGVSVAIGLGSPHASAQDNQDNPVVVMDTSFGSITIELLPADAPVSVENFLAYVNDGFFEGTIFHRVMPGFMVQGGGFIPDLTQKPTRPPIRSEARNGLTNARGTLSMARTATGIDSATSQFFISTSDNAGMLDHSGIGPEEYGYAVFGRVTEGMDVVDKIVAVSTQSQGNFDDVPLDPILVNSVTLQ
jgi:cyclophilin family peptidyl-prolyl cis-trans isomerase